MKYKEPVKRKGIRRIFKDNGYKLYLVDEFRTSCMCSICKNEIGKCEKFITRKNPKPYKSGNILVHGALRCKKCEADPLSLVLLLSFKGVDCREASTQCKAIVQYISLNNEDISIFKFLFFLLIHLL
jgi:hypothetical protein